MTSVDFVSSPASTRIFRTLKEAGRPMPEFSEDPVVDFAVLEAVVTKAVLEDREATKENEAAKEREAFRGPEGRKAWAKENGLA